MLGLSFSADAVLSAMLGAVVGSFLNVVIHRLPRGESIVTPRSRCPGCEGLIPAWANVPIVSWLALRARCHRCGTAIAVQYPLVELATALLFLALFARYGPGLRLLATWYLGAVLIASAFIDGEHRIIPNELTLPAIPLGLAFAWVAPPPDLVQAGLGLGIVGGMMWAVSAGYEWWTGRIGLGLGDVKLVAAISTFVGVRPALWVLIAASLVGIAHALVMFALGRGGRLTRIPFGPALAAAGIAALYWGESLLGYLV